MSILLRKRDWNYKKSPEIKWNFTKFLVDREGNVVDRFEPTDSMEAMEGRIVECLRQPCAQHVERGYAHG